MTKAGNLIGHRLENQPKNGRCLAGRMAMHTCQIGPTDTAPPCPGSPLWACIGTKGGSQRMVVLAYEIPFLFFGKGIVRSDVMNDIFPSLMTCTLIIKQVPPKFSDLYIFNWHSKFSNCLTWPKVHVLPQICQIKVKFQKI